MSDLPSMNKNLWQVGSRNIIFVSLIMLNFTLYGQKPLNIELTWEIGFLYQPSKVINDPGQFVESPKGLSLAISPNFGTAITILKNKNLHKLRLNFSEWQHAFSYKHDSDNIATSSSSESYWFLTYNWGKRWQIKESNKMNFQLSFGPTLGVVQKSRLPPGRDQTVSINIDGDLINIQPQNFSYPNSSLGVTAESVLNIWVYKSVGILFGLNGSFWFNPIYVDREFQISVNSDPIPNSVIRSYKHVLSLQFGVSVDI